MRKEKPDRIYIFVPRYFEIDGKQVKMTAGRAAAQCAHVAAKLSNFYEGVGDMTTIILAAESPNHLKQIESALMLFKVPCFLQHDNYDSGTETVLQAVATVPLTGKESQIFAFCRLF